MFVLLTSVLLQSADALAELHYRAGEFCDDHRQFAWAVGQFERALEHDANHLRTRLRLGFAWENGGWVRTRTVDVATENRLDPDEAFEVGRGLNRILKEGGERFAQRFVEQGEFEEALRWNPANSEARRALGFVRVDGRWRTEAGAALARRMRESVAAAPAGQQGAEVTDIETKMGLVGRRRVTDHFIVISTHHDADALADLARHAEATHAMFQSLTGLDPDAPRIALVFLSSKEEHGRFIDSQISEARMREEFKMSTGAHLGDVHEDWYHHSGDFAIHSAVHSLVRARFGDARAGLIEGLAHLLSLEMIRGAKSKCWVEGDRIQPRNADRRTEVRDMALDMADPAIATVLKVPMNELTGDKALKAWSVLEFLALDHHDRFVKFMERLSKDPDDTGEKAVQETFGWSLRELDDRWRACVRSTY